MTLLRWGMYGLAAALALAAVVYLYRSREMPGRGRALLAALRFMAVAVLLLVLFDPTVPVPGMGARGGTRVLLDGSLSMLLPAGPGRPQTRWQAAVAAARELAAGRRVFIFGESPRALAVDSLVAVHPDAAASRLLPALQAAAEGGALRVVALTDGEIEDSVEVARALPRLGLTLEVRPVAVPVADRALVEVAAPAWAQAGEPLEVRATVLATGAAEDSLVIVLREGEVVRARARVATPGPGRVASALLRFEPAAAAAARDANGGLVRYDVALETGDAIPDDDRRSIYVFVSEQPAGVTLVSLRPDWEPRFLQPALEQSLGLPVRGYLRMPSGAYVRTGVALEGGRAVPEPEVRRAAAAADLLVLHGVGEDAPPWTLELARRARRVLVFPAAQAQRVGVPATPRPPVPGEWYITDAPPPSPLAPLLAAMPVQELAPLGELRPVDAPPGAWAPLEASRGRRGPTAPVLLAGGQGGRRWAVALADGFWQWAFRGGAPREAYRRLWAAVGGWLIEEETVPLAAAIRPIERVAARGVPVRWLAAGLSPDSLSLRVLDQQGAIALDTMLRSLRQDTAHGPVLPPGHYRYQARAFAQGREAGGADGAFTVESYSPEFTRPRVGLEGVVAPSASAAAGSFPTAPRRLHASPWPYLLFVSLLCVEWALRRRWGLR